VASTGTTRVADGVGQSTLDILTAALTPSFAADDCTESVARLALASNGAPLPADADAVVPLGSHGPSHTLTRVAAVVTTKPTSPGPNCDDALGAVRLASSKAHFDWLNGTSSSSSDSLPPSTTLPA
jgi:hypothetical protein